MDSYQVFRRSHPWISKVIDGSWWRIPVLWILTESLRIAISLILVLTWEAPAQVERVAFRIK